MCIFEIMRLILITFLLLARTSFSATVYDTLYINHDTVDMGNFMVHRIVFNETPVFSKINKHLEIAVNDILELTIINTDTSAHDISHVNGNFIAAVSASGETIISLQYNNFGSYGIKLSDPSGDLLGALTVIQVGFENKIHFHWTLYDMEHTITQDISENNITTIPADYLPDVYTINGLVYPGTTTDPLGAVSAQVGDTIYVSIANGGNMFHTLHFHGFHYEIMQSQQKPETVNWIKDTSPYGPDEIVTLMFIPDKPGLYPVHDHNLISVLTSSVYPGGMITVLNIQP